MTGSATGPTDAASHGTTGGAPELARYGWDAFFATAFGALGSKSVVPGRVAVEHRRGYRLYTERGEVPATAAGRLRHAATGPQDLPTVGDWVAVRLRAADPAGVIQALLPRRTAFLRRQAGRAGVEQVLAANVDHVFIVTSLTPDLNPRRLERYLTLAWESGAAPVIVLSKADLCEDPAPHLTEVFRVAMGVPIHLLSVVDGRGLAELRPYLAGDQTVALLGSSGVGKSTLINALLGQDMLDVAEVREKDGKGRHTTTRRELIVLPEGGLILDTPGLRELQLWDAGEGLQGAFEDVAELAASCRFVDCRHQEEPGCAVRLAVDEGRLPAERLASYAKLRRELEALEARRDPRAQARERGLARAATKLLRARVAEKRSGPEGS